MKKQTVILTNQEILDALSKLEKAEKCKSISLPIKQLWELKKNIGKLEDVRKQFLSMSADIEKEYTDDEHSTETKRENGDVVRAVKKEYLQEFVQKRQSFWKPEMIWTYRCFLWTIWMTGTLRWKYLML